ncbi:response regulator transcription factor [Novispirillum itersonii]|uniref:DNA-binding response OmpR family regulator n=1 Tax=Novispirillum itersonii TaxID=189 RepID=A0A7W9ZEJ2_NOVIT|nr:response regulator transcription factor [Novispirillum itersonii]MBB6209157.1 DNA-binding response OmpR family regulator [Novispirillum itersonii]
MAEQAHILVVEDDPATLALLSAFLKEAGYAVSTAATAEAMRQAMARAAVDLILLDLNLPDADGVQLAVSVRRQSRVPIIMVTARAQPRDRITGLELGADDYVTKPFHPRELVARVRNVLGRMAPRAEASGSVLYRFSGWEMDLLWRKLVSPQGETITMTATEFDLLAVLVARAGQPLTRDQLLEATGEPGRDVNDRSIDTLVSRIRRKLGDTRGSGPRLIETCHGHGYRFSGEVQTA